MSSKLKVDIVPTPVFTRSAKSLVKKYPSLKSELKELEGLLYKNPLLGEPLGKNAYKIRLKVKSKGGGKSGGMRVITAVYMNQSPSKVYMLFIFDKSEMDNISNKDLMALLGQINIPK